jgi:uncharacterized membrane protein
MSGVFLIAAAFLASAVEMVEALTIVLAVGVTRGWRSALIGVATAVAALAAAVGALGPGLAHIPINDLRLVVGTLLLIFGLQWLRKAILRASGYRPLHDEAAVFQHEVEVASIAGRPAGEGMDWYAFTLSFKGVFLEGLEVAFIVLTFGIGTPGGIPLAASGAAAALILVGLTGVVVHRPLTTVPENTMKFVVGALLTTFGLFWAAEGAGAVWPGDEGALPVVLAFVLLTSLTLVALLRRERQRSVAGAAAARVEGD